MNLLLMPIFAFLYRCRGGYLPLGHTQLARLLYWALPVYAVVSWNFGLIVGAVSAVLAFAGLMIPHARFQSDASLKSCLGMAAIGFIRLFLILVPVAINNPSVLFLALIGLLQGAANFIGITFLGGRKFFNFAQGGSEWQEALTGTAFGIAFSILSASILRS